MTEICTFYWIHWKMFRGQSLHWTYRCRYFGYILNYNFHEILEFGKLQGFWFPLFRRPFVVCAQGLCSEMLMTSPMKTRTLCSRAGACFSWEKVVPMRVLKWKFPSRGFNSRLWEMDLFLKTRVTVLKTTRRTMVGSWQCLGPRERVLLIFKLIPKCHLDCGVLGLGVRTCPNLA